MLFNQCARQYRPLPVNFKVVLGGIAAFFLIDVHDQGVIEILQDTAVSAAGPVADAVCRQGGRSIVLRADVGVEEDVVNMFETVDRELGTLDALVNNAGIIGPRGRVDALSEANIISVLT